MTVILDNGETLDALPNDAATAAHVVRIEGNADLRGYAHPLPALRRIDGWAILRDYAHALPDGLIVRGSLDLGDCTGLTTLPPGLTVGGWLSLRDCMGLTALPDGLTVGASLDLRGCTALTALPPGLTVGGWLSLSGCTALTTLPPGLTVGGALDLSDCTGLDRYCVGRDKRNYAFFGIPMRDGPRVIAGCRNYTAARAIAHWGPGGKSNRPDCLDLAKKAIALAERSKEERP